MSKCFHKMISMPFLVFEDNSDNLLPVDKSEFFRSASEIFRSWSFCCSSSRKVFSKDSNSSVSGETRLEPPPTPVLNWGVAGSRSVISSRSDIFLALPLTRRRVEFDNGRDFRIIIEIDRLWIRYHLMTELGCLNWNRIR